MRGPSGPVSYQDFLNDRAAGVDRSRSGPTFGPVGGAPLILSRVERRWHLWVMNGQGEIWLTAVKIRVEVRDPAKNKGTGTKFVRKLRKQGRIPADHLRPQAGQHADLAQPRLGLGDDQEEDPPRRARDGRRASETVLVRDIQWDHLGKEIIHLDFARVSAGDAVETEVPIELRGVAPGLAEGGILEQLIHDILVVTCRADAIPDNIKVDISDLHIGKAIHVKELKLPEGVTTKLDPESLIVHVTTKVAEAAATEAAEGTQPEVIKPERKEKEE